MLDLSLIFLMALLLIPLLGLIAIPYFLEKSPKLEFIPIKIQK